MLKADRVHSTPPTNTTIFHEVSVANPTRRGFLSATAGLAAGGTAIALALPPAPATAALLPPLSLPVGPLDGSQASPALRAAAQVLQDAGDALDAAKAAFKVQDNLAVDWQKQNPAPTGDRRKLKRWFRRAADYRESSAMRSAWDAQLAAEDAFAAAQLEVAKVQPRDMTDLVLKACLAFVIEEPATLGRQNSHIVARSISLNLATMATRVAS